MVCLMDEYSLPAKPRSGDWIILAGVLKDCGKMGARLGGMWCAHLPSRTVFAIPIRAKCEDRFLRTTGDSRTSGGFSAGANVTSWAILPLGIAMRSGICVAGRIFYVPGGFLHDIPLQPAGMRDRSKLSFMLE